MNIEDSRSRREQLLLKEYDLITSHYMHEDSLVLARDRYFSTISIALFSIVELLPNLLGKAFSVSGTLWRILICVLGIVVCFAWISLTLAGKWYVNFRREQGAYIEKELGHLSLFQEEQKLSSSKSIKLNILAKTNPRPKRFMIHGDASVLISATFIMIWIVYGSALIWTLVS